jgi:hypothetical protein
MPSLPYPGRKSSEDALPPSDPATNPTKPPRRDIDLPRRAHVPNSAQRLIPLAIPVKVAGILADCAEKHGVTTAMIHQGKRDAPVVAAKRAAAIQLSELGFSSSAISRYLGGITHSSVLYLLGRIKQTPTSRKRYERAVRERRQVPSEKQIREERQKHMIELLDSVLQKPLQIPDLSGEWDI